MKNDDFYAGLLVIVVLVLLFLFLFSPTLILWSEIPAQHYEYLISRSNGEARFERMIRESYTDGKITHWEYSRILRRINEVERIERKLKVKEELNEIVGG